MRPLTSANLNGKITAATNLPQWSTVTAVSTIDSRQQFRTILGSNGQFLVELPEGTYDVIIHLPGYPLEFIGGLSLRGPLTIDRHYTEPARSELTLVHGTLHTEDGRPAAGWIVTAHQPTSKQTVLDLPGPVITNSIGEFTITLFREQFLILTCADPRGGINGTIPLPVSREGALVHIAVGSGIVRENLLAPPLRGSNGLATEKPEASKAFVPCQQRYDYTRLEYGYLTPTNPDDRTFLKIDPSVGNPNLVSVWIEFDESINIHIDPTGLHTPIDVVAAALAIYTFYNVDAQSVDIPVIFPFYTVFKVGLNFQFINTIEMSRRPDSWWTRFKPCSG